MNLKEIVKNARAENATAFGKVNDKRAVQILRAAFKQVNAQIEATKEGNLTIGGLGRFAIKNIEREKNDVKVTKRRVTFRQRSAAKKPKGK